jgi:transposase-like protein
MTPKKRIPDPTPSCQDLIAQTLAEGLDHLTLREILGLLLSSLSQAERHRFLQEHHHDKANGFYHRNLQLGSLPLQIKVPRTRSGSFRPSLLPEPYQRAVPEERETLLLGLLASSRSLNAAKAALRRMGLSASQEDLETIAQDLVEELELRNSRPIDPDLLALFLDAKAVDVREGDRLRPATIYVAVGLRRDGTKRVLACLPLPGRECLEHWKKILRHLLERGLRRVLIIVQDDFPGLRGLCESLFPRADVQLCTIHMQRNAKSHLSRQRAAEFQQHFKTIKACYDPELAAAQFEELCRRFQEDAPGFIHELRSKRPYYLAFLNYPEAIRRTLSTTNVVESVNGQLERLRCNSGGYFHSERILKLKLGMTIAYLEEGRWKRPDSRTHSVLPQLNAMFERRFEENHEALSCQTQLS